MKNLAIRRGKTAREYILGGKRKKYYNPFTFLLLVLGFTVFIDLDSSALWQNKSGYRAGGLLTQISPEQAGHSSRPGGCCPPKRERHHVVSLSTEKTGLSVIAFIAIPICSTGFLGCFSENGPAVCRTPGSPDTFSALFFSLLPP